MSHCADCKGLADRRPVNPERNPFLEEVVRQWAATNGYVFAMTHGAKRSTINLGRQRVNEETT